MTKLNRDDVIGIVGPLDDFRIARIIATGASAAELTEAFEWLSEDDVMGPKLRRPLSGRVGELYDILTADQPEPEER
ncbi:MAG: hypothetical protein WCF16_13025 [Alphaproteobacteria bacterium]